MVKRIRRSILYVPATRDELIPKGPKTNADTILHELDDGIGPDEEDKLAGRENLALIEDVDFGEKEVCVRINSLDTDYWLPDLQAALDVDVDAIAIPKVNHAWHIRTAVEATSGLVDDPPEFIFTIERSPGWANLEEIVEAVGDYDHVTGIYPGFETAELVGGNPMNDTIRDHFNLETLRYAPLANLDMYGTAFTEIENEERLRRTLEEEKDLGFKGRIAIHPKQVDVINEVHTPTEAEVDRAREIIERWDETDDKAFQMDDGQFVDRPIVNIQREVINRYNLIHDIDEQLVMDLDEHTAEG